MRAGKLRHRIALQKNDSGRDPDTGGDAPDNWVTYATPYASVEPLSVKDVIAAQSSNSETRARIVIRYREGVTTAHRAVHRGVIYHFDGDPLPDPDSGREYLTIPCHAGVER